MEVEIEIFYHSDETAKLESADIDYSVVECDTRLMTFYNIDNISPYFDGPTGQTFCKIYSGCTFFISTKSYEEIKEIIKSSK